MSEIVQQLVASGLVTDPASPKGTLLAAATDLFRTQGYAKTTVRDLAKVVGIQSGSLFHHFKTKEDILAAVMAETIIVCTEQMKASLENTNQPRHKIKALVECEIKSILGETGRGLGVLVFEWNSLSENNRTRVLKLRRVYEGIWLTVFEEAKSEGILVMEPALLRRFLTGALSWIVNWYNPDGDMQVPDLAELAMRMLIKEQ